MSRRSPLRIATAATAAALLLAGCVSPVAGPSGLYASPIGNAPVTSNPTPYSTALYCLADYARRYNLPYFLLASSYATKYRKRVKTWLGFMLKLPDRPCTRLSGNAFSWPRRGARLYASTPIA